MKRIKSFTGLTALLCGLASTSQATPLAPGGFAAVTPQAVGGPAPLATLSDGYLNGTLSGTVTSWVVKGDLSNPLFGATGTSLSFYYQVDNTGASAVERFTANGFAGLPVVDLENLNAAAWSTGKPGGTPASFGTRSVDGNVVGFLFPGAAEIPGGGWSDILIVHTLATSYFINSGAVIDGISANVDIYSASAVPEPTTMIAGAMLLLPFGASTLRVIRKRRVA